MNIFGTIKDSYSGEFLKGATVEVLTFDARKTGQSIAANNIGSFAITVPPGSKLLVTHVGYQPIMSDANLFDNGGFLEMDRAANSLEEVTVTAKSPKGKTNLIWYIIGGLVITKILKLW